MENLYTFLFAISFLFILFVTAIVWIYYRYVKHTRERFAFFAVTALSGFMLSSIALLVVQSPFFNWLVEMHNQQLGTEYPPFQPDDIRFNAAILFFCNALLFALIRTLYFNWNGQKSTRQANKEDTQSKVSLLDDAQYYLKVVIRDKNTIEVHKGGDSNTKREVFTEYQKEDRPWHEKAIDLLKLYDRQYDIDKEKDWHRAYKAYFGHYGEEGKRLGVLCVHGEPSAEEFQVYLKKASELKGTFEAHIVLMEGMGRKKTQHFNGVAFQYRYEIELLNSLINFRDYKRTIIKDFEDEKLENSDLTLDDMYVPVGGEMKIIVNNKLQKEENGDIESVEQFILDWAKDETANEKEHLAILGDYGQGKTVLTKKIVKEMLQHPNDYQRIPILIELRGLSPRNENEVSILGKWTNRFGGDAKALWELHKAGELLIILDGFDEMDLVGDTEVLFSHFSELWALASVPKSKIIITGRPNLFADDAERREALGLVEPRTSLPYSKAIYLNPLTTPQIKKALKHVEPATQSGILNTLKNLGEGSSFGELIMRPSTLYQLSTVWNSELAKLQDRLNSATVIGKFLNKAYERQEEKSREEKKIMVLTIQERNYFLMGIAVGMMLQNKYTNQIKHAELKKLTQNLWENYPPKLPPYQDAQQGNHAKKTLSIRLKDNQEALEVILRDVRTGGVLVQDLSGRDTFKFAHKSYLEYLVSAFYTGFVLQNEHKKTQLMMVNAISQSFKFKQTQLVASPDVERFTAENIVAEIELKDGKDEVLPIEGNEAKYQKAIFKKVNPHWYGRLFPNLTGWMSLHPAQKYFFIIFLLACCNLFIVWNTVNNTLTSSLLQGSGFLLYFLIFAIFFRCKLHLEYGGVQKATILSSQYNLYMRLYLECCRLLKTNYQPLSFNYHLFIQSLLKSNVGYFVNKSLSLFIYLALIVVLTLIGTEIELRVEGVKAEFLLGTLAGIGAVAMFYLNMNTIPLIKKKKERVFLVKSNIGSVFLLMFLSMFTFMGVATGGLILVGAGGGTLAKGLVALRWEMLAETEILGRAKVLAMVGVIGGGGFIILIAYQLNEYLKKINKNNFITKEY